MQKTEFSEIQFNTISFKIGEDFKEPAASG